MAPSNCVSLLSREIVAGELVETISQRIGISLEYFADMLERKRVASLRVEPTAHFLEPPMSSCRGRRSDVSAECVFKYGKDQPQLAIDSSRATSEAVKLRRQQKLGPD